MRYIPFKNFLGKHLTLPSGDKAYYEKDILEAEKKFTAQFIEQSRQAAVSGSVCVCKPFPVGYSTPSLTAKYCQRCGMAKQTDR